MGHKIKNNARHIKNESQKHETFLSIKVQYLRSQARKRDFPAEYSDTHRVSIHIYLIHFLKLLPLYLFPMSKSPALRRIQADIRELSIDPSERYHAHPLEHDMFEWYVCLHVCMHAT